MPSARNILLLTLALALGVVSIAVAAGRFTPDAANQSTRVATQTQYDTIRADMNEEAVDLEFLLIHARLNTPAELGDQLAALAQRSRAQAAVLAAIEPPPTIASLVVTLHEQVGAQARALAPLARRARTQGPDAVRAAQPALRAQAERIGDARRRLETAFLIGS